MSTHAAIGMKQPSGSVKAIYLHFDGYVAGAGAILGFWYTQTEQVEALLKLGDISELREKIDDCVAYHSERGEKRQHRGRVGLRHEQAASAGQGDGGRGLEESVMACRQWIGATVVTSRAHGPFRLRE